MYKALHSRYEVDRLYMSRKEGENGLACIEDSVDASIQRLEDCTQKRGENWLQPPELILTTHRSRERKLSGKKNRKENNSMDVLNNL